MFRALLLEKTAEDQVEAAIRELEDDRLPEGDVTVRITATTLNYKDGLIIRNKAPLARTFPHVPGIDFAGNVAASDDPEYGEDDPVILTGWGVGERHWGGHAERARVKGEWLVPLPDGLDLDRTMAIGTAGFTAMLAVMALEEQGLEVGQGEVLVTGGAGGVGSVAIAVLAKLGYEVTASTGRSSSHAYLTELGAANLIDRSELSEPVKRPMESARFAGCVDAVGGTTLGRLLGQMKYGASVAAVGNAGGARLETTVIPFLLRGINLLGIDSVYCPKPKRVRAWQRLARDLPQDKLDAMTQRAGLSDLPELAGQILDGKVQGRLVIDPAG
ncbi:MAG: MDR family oxidoreductase [Geminicoccaceae bacterium]|nr:MDR family oxidoreductase [Geminicoccaceae bacterium]